MAKKTPTITPAQALANLRKARTRLVEAAALLAKHPLAETTPASLATAKAAADVEMVRRRLQKLIDGHKAAEAKPTAKGRTAKRPRA